MHSFVRSTALLIATAALLTLPQVALAQRDAGSKARGDYSGTFWSTHSAQRSVRHASDYVTSTHQYLRATPKPSVEYLRAEAKDIGKNLEAAKAEVAYLTKNASADDAKAVASIQAHLKAAEAEYAKLHACCDADVVKVDEAMACCTAITDHLKKAHDELDALAKKHAPKTVAPKK